MIELKEEEEVKEKEYTRTRGRGARRHVRLAVQPTTEATSAGEGIPEVPVREWGARGGGGRGGPRENEGSRRWMRRERKRER